MDNAIGFRNTYPLDSDLSGRYRCPTFDQPGPDALKLGYRIRMGTMAAKLGSCDKLLGMLTIHTRIFAYNGIWIEDW